MGRRPDSATLVMTLQETLFDLLSVKPLRADARRDLVGLLTDHGTAGIHRVR